MYVRRNVLDLGADWAEPVLWYARAVAELKTRDLDDRTSWRFFAGIHGYHRVLWEFYGYKDPAEPLPAQADRDLFWEQCQHGSWYFLPWHRGYLYAFEKQIRHIVEKLNGPEDWALPYWNYLKTGQNRLPAAFASPDWPDGVGNNPLYVIQRYGPDPRNPGDVFIPPTAVNLSAMAAGYFVGVGNGGDPGFGGVDTGFAHGGTVHGRLESQPHDVVHVLIGGETVGHFAGSQVDLPGLMTTPATAGLDPIFWLHHANIDRLWESWLHANNAHQDPRAAKWLKGPASIGEPAFALPFPDRTAWTFAPEDVSGLSKLDYTYDDLAPAGAIVVAGANPPGPVTMSQSTGANQGAGAMAEADIQAAQSDTVETVGVSDAPVPVVGSGAGAVVRLNPEMRAKVADGLAAGSTPFGQAERVLLNLENVRGKSDAVVLNVYVSPNSPEEGKSDERAVGTIGLFGVSQASELDDKHAGQGLTYVLDITNAFSALGAGSVDNLGVRVEAVSPVRPSADVSIGRISVVRQGR